MSHNKKYDVIRSMTDEDRKAIYDFAIELSNKIINRGKETKTMKYSYIVMDHKTPHIEITVKEDTKLIDVAERAAAHYLDYCGNWMKAISPQPMMYQIFREGKSLGYFHVYTDYHPTFHAEKAK
jgi:hypothetical protein